MNSTVFAVIAAILGFSHCWYIPYGGGAMTGLRQPVVIGGITYPIGYSGVIPGYGTYPYNGLLSGYGIDTMYDGALLRNPALYGGASYGLSSYYPTTTYGMNSFYPGAATYGSYGVTGVARGVSTAQIPSTTMGTVSGGTRG